EVSFRSACKALIARGIMVDSIFCGAESDGDAALWHEVARLADGKFACIDQDHGTIVLETPFDAEIGTLSTALNATYIPIGANGKVALANQTAQDANASGANTEACAQRAQTKAGGMYTCSWDLVDACRTGQVKLGD